VDYLGVWRNEYRPSDMAIEKSDGVRRRSNY
jgi:hypothetical protein